MSIEEIIEEIENAIGLIEQNGQDYLDERDIPMLRQIIEIILKRDIIPLKERCAK